MTATNLLDPETYERRGGSRPDAFYGKSWLLYHYLTFSDARKGQFRRYLEAVQQGQGSGEAARAVFGDLGQLEKELERYVRQRTMKSIQLKPTAFPAVQVAIRELSAGEAAIMPVRIRSRSGVNAKQAAELLPDARAVAARFPKDAAVLAALAEAEHDAGHDDEAVAAADAAIAIDPNQVNAYVQKGYALFRKARKAEGKEREPAYRAARAPFVALNKLENDHPLPLLYYYLIDGRLKEQPSELAVSALARAVSVAPFDLGLRRLLVVQLIRDKHYDAAITNLTPIAYNPHGGRAAESARQLLERLQSGLDRESLGAELAASAGRGDDEAMDDPDDPGGDGSDGKGPSGADA